MRPETYGERLRRLRTERGLTMRDIAGPGISGAYISRLEHGQRTASVHATRLIAAKLEVPWQHLETGETFVPVVVAGESHDVPEPVAEEMTRLREALGCAVEDLERRHPLDADPITTNIIRDGRRVLEGRAA